MVELEKDEENNHLMPREKEPKEVTKRTTKGQSFNEFRRFTIVSSESLNC